MKRDNMQATTTVSSELCVVRRQIFTIGGAQMEHPFVSTHMLRLPTWTCMAWHSPTKLLRVGVSRSISFNCFMATASKASVGHSLNQSHVQQLTRDGLARKRSL